MSPTYNESINISKQIVILKLILLMLSTFVYNAVSLS